MKERVIFPNLVKETHPATVSLDSALSVILKDQKKVLKEPVCFVVKTPVRPSQLMMMRKLKMEVSIMRSEKDNAVILTTGSKGSTAPRVPGYDGQSTLQNSHSSVHVHTHPGRSATPSREDLEARATDTGQESFIIGGEGVVSFVPELLHPFTHSNRAALGFYGKRTLRKKGILKNFQTWDSPNLHELLQHICDLLNGTRREGNS